MRELDLTEWAEGPPDSWARPWPEVRVWSDLREVLLGDGHRVLVGRMPSELCGGEVFDRVWALHPEAYASILMYGVSTPLPRWQQAYERDYVFSGKVNGSLPLPAELSEHLSWARGFGGSQVNGVLLNWYDPELGHYIGAHRDSVVGLVAGSAVVTASLGGERVFRLRRPGHVVDVEVRDGDVVVLPWETNLAWTHEVPRWVRHRGRRVSVTFRSFA